MKKYEESSYRCAANVRLKNVHLPNDFGNKQGKAHSEFTNRPAKAF
jgi:hypothetical protein